MNRMELANAYHRKGFNCCQSVLAAFSDITGLQEGIAFNVSAGFGGGCGTGELCGAAAGAIMVLGLMYPIDPADPVTGKKRTVAMGKEFQSRFMEIFGALRCRDLMQRGKAAGRLSPAVAAMGLSGHCDIMIVSAVEIVEEMLRAQGRLA